MDVILLKSYADKEFSLMTELCCPGVCDAACRAAGSVSRGREWTGDGPLSGLLYITKIHEILYYDEFKTFELYRYIGIYNNNIVDYY